MSLGTQSVVAEVVGEHYAANRGGVAMGGPQHISSSVPTEFEGMLGEAAVLAPEGLDHPLKYLQSRILARHFHAMLKRGVTLVTVHLEPGLRASALNLWLLEVLAACVLCFDGPWIAMGDWNLEPQDLSKAAGSTRFNGKVFARSAATCAGGAGAVLDYFVLSEVMAHLVQQVEVVDNSPTGQSDSHSKPRLGVTESWRENSPSRFPRRCQQRRRLDLELAWLDWLRGRSSVVPHSRPGGAKGWSSSSFPSARLRAKDTGRSCSKQAAARRRLVAQAVGNLAPWRNRRTSQYTSQRSVHTVASILPDPGPCDPGWDFPSQEALARALHNAATRENWTGSCFSLRATRSKRPRRRRPNRRDAGGNGRRKRASGTATP